MKLLKKTDRLVTVLEKTFLFRGLSAELVQWAVDHPQSTVEEYEAGEWIYDPGICRRAVALLLSGEAVAYRSDAGEGRIILNHFTAGAMFGMASVFVEACDGLTEIAAKKRSRVLFLPQALLNELFVREPQIAIRYISFLSGRIHFLNRKIAGFTAGEVHSRLAVYLLEQAGEDQDEITLNCPLSSLCTMLDVGRASLYRGLDTLTEQGAIIREGRRIQICNRSLLQKISRGLQEERIDQDEKKY